MKDRPEVKESCCSQISFDENAADEVEAQLKVSEVCQISEVSNRKKGDQGCIGAPRLRRAPPKISVPQGTGASGIFHAPFRPGIPMLLLGRRHRITDALPPMKDETEYERSRAFLS